MSFFEDLREKYPEFEYNSYSIKDEGENIVIRYFFDIPGLAEFRPVLKIAKKKFKWNNINTNRTRAIVFYLGMVEAISYYKATCAERFVVNCGKLTNDQKVWFKKLYYLGLGEFRYRNQIEVEQKDFVDFISYGMPIEIEDTMPETKGIIVPIGGGKDSVVTLSLLKDLKDDILCFRINSNDVSNACCETAGYDNSKVIEVTRTIDQELIELNNKGFLNGHTPFSAMVAFLTYLVANLLNKHSVILSNEDSANQTNVEGQNINHQYSKTYEFETDFRIFAKKYMTARVNYFSMLRPITEIQIAKLFSQNKEFYKVFKSCNVGSKQTPWVWCCDCPKCLFVYTILSPFIEKEELVDIFGEELFSKESLEEIFLELCGFKEVKPFECVGTFEEVQYAVSQTIKQYEVRKEELPYLLKLYKDNYKLRDGNFEKYYNTKHHVPLKYDVILKKALDIK
jgi:hypothetical protein